MLHTNALLQAWQTRGCLSIIPIKTKSWSNVSRMLHTNALLQAWQTRGCLSIIPIKTKSWSNVSWLLYMISLFKFEFFTYGIPNCNFYLVYCFVPLHKFTFLIYNLFNGIKNKLNNQIECNIYNKSLRIIIRDICLLR